MRRLFNALVIVSIAATISGCVEGGGGGRWCYYHPHRCP
jgi:hypothetical protein